MLKRLFIQNVALIDSAELEFSEGLNVLTGETGSGKSVILDSIDFVLGAKADKGMVRSGQEACFVRAEFTAPEGVQALLQEYDIEAEDTLIVSRKLTAEGKGAIKLNGCPVTAAMLRRVTALLVDVHGQSEHFFLLKESNQLRLLDGVAGEGVASAKKNVKELLSKRREIIEELKILGGDEGERSRRMDILKFQIEEISHANLKEGEEEELKALRTRYQHAERILSGLSAARDFLLADGGGADAVRSAQRALNSVSKYEGQCESLAERLQAAAEELRDVADTVDSLMEELDIDERDFERVENRLDELKALGKKYGGDVKAMLAFAERAEEEYELLADSGERYEKLSSQLVKVEDKLYEACLSLTKERKRAAEGFCGRVVEELKTLNSPSARFEVQFDPYEKEDVSKANAEGLGGIRFLFSANAGEPLKELGKIISGGEMSRFMLAVKAQLSAAGGIGTYVFDEIDAGIGGKTARVVAEKFAKIAKHVQLLAVTHLAQIASFADRSFLIAKQVEGGNTYTRIRALEKDEQLCEIARLVGGDSAHVRAHAKELLEEAFAYKNSLK
ncbi:MAG: DNA repair protein RecN [Clostridia bacterium]|nr:DNA repair protein RecN [Clostridia bacterium]